MLHWGLWHDTVMRGLQLHVSVLELRWGTLHDEILMTDTVYNGVVGLHEFSQVLVEF
jgi:hypothetical protein